MGKKHKKHKAEWRSSYEDYADKPLEKPLKLVLKVGGSEVTELSGSGHDSSYYDDRSDHERERHREKKKKKKKKSEKEKHLDDEERRKRKVEAGSCSVWGGSSPVGPYLPTGQSDSQELVCQDVAGGSRWEEGSRLCWAVATWPLWGTRQHCVCEVLVGDPSELHVCEALVGDLSALPVCEALVRDPSALHVCEALVGDPLALLVCEALVRDPSALHVCEALVGDPSALLVCRALVEDPSTLCVCEACIGDMWTRHCCVSVRKDPHGFFAFPVTDAIAPGYSMIIKHPMDFGTMKDKIVAHEYKSVTEFKADFKLMCDNAMTYNRPDTVYYKLAKKILHAGFKMMSKQAALLGSEDTAVEEPVPEVVPVQVETAKKSKKPSKEVLSCVFEPEGNACSLTDSTAEEHVLALVEHAADEARDRINRFLPGGKMGYLKKNGDGSLLYSVVNVAEPDAEASGSTRQLLVTDKSPQHPSTVFVQCAVMRPIAPEHGVRAEHLQTASFSLQEFVKDAGRYSQKLVDDLLDQITGGDHSRMLVRLKQVGTLPRQAAHWALLLASSWSTRVVREEHAVFRESLAILPLLALVSFALNSHFYLLERLEIEKGKVLYVCHVFAVRGALPNSLGPASFLCWQSPSLQSRFSECRSTVRRFAQLVCLRVCISPSSGSVFPAWSTRPASKESRWEEIEVMGEHLGTVWNRGCVCKEAGVGGATRRARHAENVQGQWHMRGQVVEREALMERALWELWVGDSLGDGGGSVLDFMSMKPYSDVSLDISMLSSLGKVKKELDHDEGHLGLDETTKLLQDLHEAQTERGGSRPSSNLSSLSNTSERDAHHLGKLQALRQCWFFRFHAAPTLGTEVAVVGVWE
ncbi:bromodomain-containing protein 9 [Trichechus manatus latirostris]|uniref:Bromodomain-containing protein 9 n=1 Tax=Trichechus manatus latirostris TaxID=127582 RepID=A0A2Y9R7V5_TRIMA|nr:bromodomain-containing protein 9 [Trichechus manatus latirostris]